MQHTYAEHRYQSQKIISRWETILLLDSYGWTYWGCLFLWNLSRASVNVCRNNWHWSTLQKRHMRYSRNKEERGTWHSYTSNFQITAFDWLIIVEICININNQQLWILTTPSHGSLVQWTVFCYSQSGKELFAIASSQFGMVIVSIIIQ
jgi:hypothetical protein